MNELFCIEWQDEDFWLNKEVSACLCGVKAVDVHMRVKNGQIKERSDEMVTLGQGPGKWDVKSCSDQNGRFVLRSAFIWSFGGGLKRAFRQAWNLNSCGCCVAQGTRKSRKVMAVIFM